MIMVNLFKEGTMKSRSAFPFHSHLSEKICCLTLDFLFLFLKDLCT